MTKTKTQGKKSVQRNGIKVRPFRTSAPSRARAALFIAQSGRIEATLIPAFVHLQCGITKMNINIYIAASKLIYTC